jgi:hypothetical protein
VERIDTKPRHPRTKDANDPLHTARSAETTSLWRLTPRPSPGMLTPQMRREAPPLPELPLGICCTL